MNGYMLFRRNNNNQCGISSYTYYPVLSETSGSTTSVKSTTTTKNSATTPLSKVTTIRSTQARTFSTILTTSPSFKLTTSSKIPCPKGEGGYAMSGCQLFYYCTIYIDYYKCYSGYLFDEASSTCKLASLVQCKV